MKHFEIAGCVKIYKKPRDTDSRGKYIPKHKRGPDVELFKGQRNSRTIPFIFYLSALVGYLYMVVSL